MRDLEIAGWTRHPCMVARRMTWETVRVNLSDGSYVDLPRSTAEQLYDLMWLLAPEKGAVTTAAKLNQALRQALVRDESVVLDAPESQVFSNALQRLL